MAPALPLMLVPSSGLALLRSSSLWTNHPPFWKALLRLLGEPAGKQGVPGMAGMPDTEAAMQHPGHRGHGQRRACHRTAIPRPHHVGDSSKNSIARGQAQIVLKHTNELGSGGAREFSMSAESDSVRVYCVHPIKMQLLIEMFGCGFRRCKESGPHIQPNLLN